MKRIISHCIFFLMVFIGSAHLSFSQTTVNFNSYLENQGLTNPHEEGELKFEAILGSSATCSSCIGIDINEGKDNSPGLDDSNFEIGGIIGWKISRTDNSPFQFISLWINDRGPFQPNPPGTSTQGTIKAFKSGAQVGADKTVIFNSFSEGIKSYASDPDFYDVDSVLIEGIDLFLILDEITYNDPFIVGDADPAEVTAINLVGSPLSTATSVQFRVDFSKIANNVSSDDFVLTRTGTANGTIGAVSGNNSTYYVEVNGISGEGTIRLDLPDGTDITNENDVDGTSAFTSGQVHNVSPCLVEDFEDETDGSKSFSYGGFNFSIAGNLEVHTENPTIGINGSKYVLINTGVGPYIINSNTSDINLRKFAVYLSSISDGNDVTSDGTITVIGKKDGNTVYSVTKSSGFPPNNTGTLKGYSIFDLATEGGTDNSIKSVDQIEIILGGAFQYINIDNFEFCADDVAPSGYDVSIDQNPITPDNDDAVSFTFTGAEVGTTYEYTFSSTGGGANVTGSGTIITATDQITGIDLTDLGLGTITLSVNLTDASNNEGLPAQDEVQKRINNVPIATPPTAPIVTEDATVPLADDIQISDIDGDDQTVTFTVTGGTVTLGTTGITFGGSGNGSASFTAAGTLAAINTALDAATFTPTPGLVGSNAGTIAFVANDGLADSNTATVTFDILPGLPSVALSIAPLSRLEGDATANVVTATLSNASTSNVTVNLSLSGTATNTVDYTISSTSITITSGSTTGSVTITNVNDAFYELDETVIVDISSVTDGIEDGVQQATYTITNDDAIPIASLEVLDIYNPITDESGGQAYVRAKLNAIAGTTVSVPLVFSGTATGGGTDYAITGSTITILPGEPMDSIRVTSLFDGVEEGNETIIVDMGTPTNAVEDGVQQVTLTIIDEDAIDPLVTSVSVPANATYLASQNLDFTVNFSENVTVNTTGGTPQLSLTIGSTIRQAVYQSGSGTSALIFRYTVQTGDLDTDGIAIGTLSPNGGTLRDAVSNDANLTLNSVGSTSAVLVDAVAPTITSVNVPANETYIAGNNLDFAVNFSENVTVNTAGGTPQLSLTIGATTRQATYQSGSGTSALIFRYTVQSGELDNDGIAVGTLSANGGTLKDAAGNNANLTLNSVGSTSAVLVDAVAPTVTSVTVPANATYLASQNLDFTVNFSENVTVNTAGGTPELSLTIGATTRQAVYQSGSGTSALLFRYTVQIGELDTDGIAVGTLAPNGGTLRDVAGNNANLTLNSVGSTASVFVNAVLPTVSISASPISVTEAGEVFRVTATLSALSGVNVTIPLVYSGDAVQSTDYGFVDIPIDEFVIVPGQLSLSVDLISIPDDIVDGDKDFVVSLGILTNGTPGTTTQATVTITDDDTAELSIAATTNAAEDATDGLFTITTDKQFTSPVTVTITVGGDATEGTDYETIGTTVVFPANQSSVTIPVSVIGDDLVEDVETVIVTMTGTDNAAVTIGFLDQATVMIADNDLFLLVDASASGTPVPVGEDALLSATVTSDQPGYPPVAGVTVTFSLDGVEKGTGVTNAQGVATLTIPASDLSNLPIVYKVLAEAGTGEGRGESIAYLPIYDPNGNFVTGGGWIMSPAGAYKADENLTGKANFGFVSKYKKGSNQVEGKTDFQFKAADLNFKSTLHESGTLVISGKRATYRGEGTINDVPGFRFTLVALDGDWNGGTDPDQFRIKIWGDSGIIYDNGMGADETTNASTVLGGGSISIKEAKGKNNKRVVADLIEVPWNTSVEEVKKEIATMSSEWFDGKDINLSINTDSYNAIQSGIYMLQTELEENEWFELDEPISVNVLVRDKPMATDIQLSNTIMQRNIRNGSVIGDLRTVDPVDDQHRYTLAEHSDFELVGNSLIWRGTGVPATASITVFSTDRAGQSIERVIELSREPRFGDFNMFPNPTDSDVTIEVELDQSVNVGIRIFDAVGRLVFEQEGVETGNVVYQINIDHLSSGLYTVQLSTGKLVVNKRLIKK